MRIAQSPASVRDIKAAWEQDLEPLCKEEPGVLRVSVFRDEHINAYVNLAAYRSENIANRFLQRAIEVRKRSGTLLNKVVVNEPEMTEATILGSIGG
jgi:hypothetical protein